MHVIRSIRSFFATTFDTLVFMLDDGEYHQAAVAERHQKEKIGDYAEPPHR